jgi:predicted aspartyl protease
MQSLSNKRLIVEATVNGYTAPFLIDTGATVRLIDRSRINEFRINEGPKYNGTLVGAGGEMRGVRYCYTLAVLEDGEKSKPIGQFLLADIDDVVESIEAQTGIRILGIISLPQMKVAGVRIDTNSNILTLE